MKQASSAIVFCLIFLICQKSYSARLTDSEKKQYKEEGTYLELVENSKDLVRKKIIIKAVYTDTSNKLQAPYHELLGSKYSIITIENGKSIPIVFSSEDVRKGLAELTPNKLARIYGVLLFKNYNASSSKKAGEKVDMDKAYYFEVADVEAIDKKDNEVDLSKFNNADYSDVEAKRIDLQYGRFLDRKVRFLLTYRDTDNRIPNQFSKLTKISDDTHFQLLTSDLFHTLMIVSRDNDQCVNSIVKAQAGAKLQVSGILKGIEDPSQKNAKTEYYIEVHNITESAKDAGKPEIPSL